jgi:Tfp pilus assembly protein PilP
MAKKKKNKKAALRNFLIICGVLIVAQVLFLVLREEKKPVTVRQAIDVALSSQQDMSATSREQKRIVLALTDYMMKNQNKAPEQLTALVPQYFDTVPIDPAAGKPFTYRLVDGRPQVLSEADLQTIKPKSPQEMSEVEMEKAEQEALLLAVSSGETLEEEFVYDPTGKRDPFTPYDMSSGKAKAGDGIFCCELGQFRLSIVLMGDTPTAIVEAADGKGHTVTVGSKIGINRAEVVEILADRIRVLEKSVDFTGKEISNTFELKLRTKN